MLENHCNDSHSVQPFDKPEGALRKFLAYDIYALPPQILPCADIDLSDFRYLYTDFAPVKHPFKDLFNTESYNSMWLDHKSVVSEPDLHQVCGKTMFKDSTNVDTPDNIPPVNKSDSPVNTELRSPSLDITPESCPVIPHPDLIDQMDVRLHDNNAPTAIPLGTPIVDEITPTPDIDTLSIEK